MFQNRENPMIVRMKFISTKRPVAVTIVFIFESLAFHIPLLNKLKQIEKKKFDDKLNNLKNHTNRKRLLKDTEKSEKINHFSQESKDLITEMCNNEIFEFCETSSKRQCPDCAAYWEIGIVHCTCGKYMQPTEKSRLFNKNRFDTMSILGYVIKRNQSRGPRHGQSVRQTMNHKARDMLRKAKLPKDGSCETILVRWYREKKYRKSLSEEGWTEEKIRQHDALALEDHMKLHLKKGDDGKGTPGKLFFNKGVQGPTRQRPHFREAKHAYRRLFREHVESTGERRMKQVDPSSTTNKTKIIDNNMKVPRSPLPRFTLALDGNISIQQVRLHPRCGSRTMNGTRHKVGIIGDLQHGCSQCTPFGGRWRLVWHTS